MDLVPTYDVLDTTVVQDDLSESMLQAKAGQLPNDILKELINLIEVHSFVEVVPSINDIFIDIVEGGKS